MNCDECKRAEEKSVSWAYVELLNESHKSTIKRLWITIVALILVLALAFGVVAYGVYEWSQYDTMSYDQDGDGINIIGDDNRGYYNEPAVENTAETEP